MAAFLQYHMRGYASRTYFQHVLFQNKMLSPELFNVGLDCAADGTEIVETCAAAIDFAALEKYEATFYEVIEQFFILLHLLG